MNLSDEESESTDRSSEEFKSGTHDTYHTHPSSAGPDTQEWLISDARMDAYAKNFRIATPKSDDLGGAFTGAALETDAAFWEEVAGQDGYDLTGFAQGNLQRFFEESDDEGEKEDVQFFESNILNTFGNTAQKSINAIMNFAKDDDDREKLLELYFEMRKLINSSSLLVQMRQNNIPSHAGFYWNQHEIRQTLKNLLNVESDHIDDLDDNWTQYKKAKMEYCRALILLFLNDDLKKELSELRKKYTKTLNAMVTEKPIFNKLNGIKGRVYTQSGLMKPSYKKFKVPITFYSPEAKDKAIIELRNTIKKKRSHLEALGGFRKHCQKKCNVHLRRWKKSRQDMLILGKTLRKI